MKINEDSFIGFRKCTIEYTLVDVSTITKHYINKFIMKWIKIRNTVIGT